MHVLCVLCVCLCVAETEMSLSFSAVFSMFEKACMLLTAKTRVEFFFSGGGEQERRG